MKGKTTNYMSTVKVGPKGQIIIPKEIRDMFQIEPGDNLIMMADIQRGIAINKQSIMEDIAKAIFDGNGKNVYPKENEQDLNTFADALTETAKKGSSVL